MSHPTTVLEAMAFLQANPDMHQYGSKRLSAMVTEPKCCPTTWKKARKRLDIPDAPRYRKAPQTRKQQRKAADATYWNTHKIVIDTQAMKIIFHGENGYKVTKKQDSKAISASLRLFRWAKFVTREHNTETGIIVMTLEAQS